MKLIVLTFALFLFAASAFTQKSITIKVPEFADPEIKAFYNAYASHLIKCVEAIRKKDESKATALFKNPGAQLVEREKILAKEVYATEKQKYMQFVAQVYPYIKEVERSVYYKKLYGKK